MNYEVVPSEFKGLFVKAIANGKLYKLYFAEDLINAQGLQKWRWDSVDYYKQFLDQNLDKILLNVESGHFHSIHGGYDIDNIPNDN